MDYKGIIDFNKYTLAVATGGLLYSFEKLPTFSNGFPTFVVLSLLAIFAISLLLAVCVFAAATRSLHLPAERAGELDNAIRHLGTWHSALLLIGVLLLGGTMFIYALTTLKDEKPEKCCCCGHNAMLEIEHRGLELLTSAALTR